MSKIEWTEQTWNPIVGCSLASPGCTNCYAMKMAGRLEAMAHKGNARLKHYKGTTQKTKSGFAWTGKIGFNEDALLKPLKRKKPTIYFVNSMSDLFHPDVSDEIRDQIFAIMALCPQHTFQILTKRPDIMREYITSINTQNIISIAGEFDLEGCFRLDIDYKIGKIQIFPLPNVWLGTSVENQKYAEQRIPDLLATPAAVRFLSCEPLIGPIDFAYCKDGLPDNMWESPLEDIDWVIVGGESGKGARAMHRDWARTIRDQCAAIGTDFYFKQWGDWLPYSEFAENKGAYGKILGVKPENFEHLDDRFSIRVGKSKSGRFLDGVIHDKRPEVKL